MAYDTNPTEEYVQNYARRMESFWGQQKKLDGNMWRLYRRMEAMDVTEPASQAGETKIKPLRTGFAGIVVDRDMASLAASWFVQVKPRTKEEKDIKHANSLLEPWFQGVGSQSQVGEVLVPQARDMRVLGRGWSNYSVLPRLWAEKDFRAMVEERQALQGKLADADDEDAKRLREEIKDLQDRIADYKVRNFPLRWCHSSARVVWPQLSKERFLPEIVEIREMSLGQIRAEYGDDKVPGPRQDDSDTTKTKVLVYTNHVWTKTIVADYGTDGKTGDPRMAHEWDHDAGMSPYVLFETNADYDAADGIVWKSALYDFKDMLETENEILSDMRHKHRREANTPLVLTTDPELRDEEVGPQGKAKEVGVGDDNIVRLHKGESLVEGPTSRVTPQSMELLQHVHEFNMQILLNPTLMGIQKAGTSGVGFEVAKLTAKENLGPYRRAVQRGLQHWAQLTCRHLERINREFPAYPDPIVVVDEKFGQLAVEPKDLRGWESYIGVRLAEIGVIDEQRSLNMATGAQSLPLSPHFILQKYLNIENAKEEIDMWKRWQIESSLIQLIQQYVQQHSGVLMQQTAGGGTAEIAEQIQELPMEPMAALAQNQVPEAVAAFRQTAPNVRRGAAQVQQLSETQAMQQGPV